MVIKRFKKGNKHYSDLVHKYYSFINFDTQTLNKANIIIRK